jgi:hypothetical protein
VTSRVTTKHLLAGGCILAHRHLVKLIDLKLLSADSDAQLGKL